MRNIMPNFNRPVSRIAHVKLHAHQFVRLAELQVELKRTEDAVDKAVEKDLESSETTIAKRIKGVDEQNIEGVDTATIAGARENIKTHVTTEVNAARLNIKGNEK